MSNTFNVKVKGRLLLTLLAKIQVYNMKIFFKITGTHFQRKKDNKQPFF